jgi:hypothetical protein
LKKCQLFFFLINRQDLQTSLLNQAAYFAAGSVYSHGLFPTSSSSSTATPTNNSTYIHH